MTMSSEHRDSMTGSVAERLTVLSIVIVGLALLVGWFYILW